MQLPVLKPKPKPKSKPKSKPMPMCETKMVFFTRNIHFANGLVVGDVGCETTHLVHDVESSNGGEEAVDVVLPAKPTTVGGVKVHDHLCSMCMPFTHALGIATKIHGIHTLPCESQNNRATHHQASDRASKQKENNL